MAANLVLHQVAGTLNLTVVRGNSLVQVDGGVKGDSDPYVVIEDRDGHRLGKTKVIDDDINPVWDYTLAERRFTYREDFLKFIVKDEETFGKNQPMGHVFVSIGDLLADGAIGTKTRDFPVTMDPDTIAGLGHKLRTIIEAKLRDSGNLGTLTLRWSITLDAVAAVPRHVDPVVPGGGAARQPSGAYGVDAQTFFVPRNRDAEVPQGDINDDALKQEMIALVRDAERETRSLEGKHIIALLGASGSGKTALLHFLQGVDLNSRTIRLAARDDRTGTNRLQDLFVAVPAVDTDDTKAFPITHHEQATKIVCAKPLALADGTSAYVVDFPSDASRSLGARTSRVMLKNSLLKLFTLRRASSVRIVLCLTREDLDNGGGAGLSELTSLTSDIGNCLESSVVVLRPFLQTEEPRACDATRLIERATVLSRACRAAQGRCQVHSPSHQVYSHILNGLQHFEGVCSGGAPRACGAIIANTLLTGADQRKELISLLTLQPPSNNRDQFVFSFPSSGTSLHRCIDGNVATHNSALKDTVLSAPQLTNAAAVATSLFEVREVLRNSLGVALPLLETACCSITNEFSARWAEAIAAAVTSMERRDHLALDAALATASLLNENYLKVVSAVPGYTPPHPPIASIAHTVSELSKRTAELFREMEGELVKGGLLERSPKDFWLSLGKAMELDEVIGKFSTLKETFALSSMQQIATKVSSVGSLVTIEPSHAMHLKACHGRRVEDFEALQLSVGSNALSAAIRSVANYERFASNAVKSALSVLLGGGATLVTLKAAKDRLVLQLQRIVNNVKSRAANSAECATDDYAHLMFLNSVHNNEELCSALDVSSSDLKEATGLEALLVTLESPAPKVSGDVQLDILDAWHFSRLVQVLEARPLLLARRNKELEALAQHASTASASCLEEVKRLSKLFDLHMLEATDVVFVSEGSKDIASFDASHLPIDFGNDLREPLGKLAEVAKCDELFGAASTKFTALAEQRIRDVAKFAGTIAQRSKLFLTSRGASKLCGKLVFALACFSQLRDAVPESGNDGLMDASAAQIGTSLRSWLLDASTRCRNFRSITNDATRPIESLLTTAEVMRFVGYSNAVLGGIQGVYRDHETLVDKLLAAPVADACAESERAVVDTMMNLVQAICERITNFTLSNKLDEIARMVRRYSVPLRRSGIVRVRALATSHISDFQAVVTQLDARSRVLAADADLRALSDSKILCQKVMKALTCIEVTDDDDDHPAPLDTQSTVFGRQSPLDAVGVAVTDIISYIDHVMSNETNSIEEAIVRGSEVQQVVAAVGRVSSLQANDERRRLVTVLQSRITGLISLVRRLGQMAVDAVRTTDVSDGVEAFKFVTRLLNSIKVEHPTVIAWETHHADVVLAQTALVELVQRAQAQYIESLTNGSEQQQHTSRADLNRLKPLREILVDENNKPLVSDEVAEIEALLCAKKRELQNATTLQDALTCFAALAPRENAFKCSPLWTEIVTVITDKLQLTVRDNEATYVELCGRKDFVKMKAETDKLNSLLALLDAMRANAIAAVAENMRGRVGSRVQEAEEMEKEFLRNSIASAEEAWKESSASDQLKTSFLLRQIAHHAAVLTSITTNVVVSRSAATTSALVGRLETAKAEHATNSKDSDKAIALITASGLANEYAESLSFVAQRALELAMPSTTEWIATLALHLQELNDAVSTIQVTGELVPFIVHNVKRVLLNKELSDGVVKQILMLRALKDRDLPAESRLDVEKALTTFRSNGSHLIRNAASAIQRGDVDGINWQEALTLLRALNGLSAPSLQVIWGNANDDGFVAHPNDLLRDACIAPFQATIKRTILQEGQPNKEVEVPPSMALYLQEGNIKAIARLHHVYAVLKLHLGDVLTAGMPEPLDFRTCDVMRELEELGTKALSQWSSAIDANPPVEDCLITFDNSMSALASFEASLKEPTVRAKAAECKRAAEAKVQDYLKNHFFAEGARLVQALTAPAATPEEVRQRELACDKLITLQIDLRRISVRASILHDTINNAIARLLTELSQNALEEFVALVGQKMFSHRHELSKAIIAKQNFYRDFLVNRFVDRAGGLTIDDAVKRLAWVDFACESDVPTSVNEGDTVAKEFLLASITKYVNETGVGLQELFKSIPEAKLQIFASLSDLSRKIATQEVDRADIVSLIHWLCKAYALYQFEQSTQRKKVITPHIGQVLCLYRLLGVDSPKKQRFCDWMNDVGTNLPRTYSLQNHMAQIKTGEGKSITLAVLASFFALIGVPVDIVCYSEYLTERDQESMKPFFVFLKLMPADADVVNLTESQRISKSLIHYETFSSLCGRRLGAVPKVAKHILHNGTDYPEPVDFSGRRGVLLIDEVDVFFSQRFYGKTYNAGIKLQDPSIVALVRKIYRGRTTQYNVLALPELAVVKQRFPKLAPYLDPIACQLQTNADNYSKREGDPRPNLKTKMIEYQSGDSYTDKIVYANETMFLYLQYTEGANAQFTNEEAEAKIGLDIIIGQFSYAEITSSKYYHGILGVTGSLDSIPDKDKEELRSALGVQRQTFVPSLYGSASRLNGSKGFVYETDLRLHHLESDWAAAIEKEAVAKAKGNSVLIFCKNRLMLEKLRQRPHLSKCAVVTEDVEIHTRDGKIQSATDNNTITLLTRSYGRGTDFRDYCEDGSSKVVVICTFFPSTASELVQIKGRTARESKDGIFQMELCLDHLAEKFFFEEMTGATESDKAGRLEKIAESVRVAQVDVAGRGLQKLLEEKQGAKTRLKLKGRDTAKLSAKEKDTASWATMTLLVSDAPIEDKVKAVMGPNIATLQSKNMYIVMLDHSGSMTNLLPRDEQGKQVSCWDALRDAFDLFLNELRKENPEDTALAVVLFHDDATVRYVGSVANYNKRLPTQCPEGYTDFNSPFSAAGQLIEGTYNDTDHVMFVWDCFGGSGEMCGKKYPEKPPSVQGRFAPPMEELPSYATFKKSLVFLTDGFGGNVRGLDELLTKHKATVSSFKSIYLNAARGIPAQLVELERCFKRHGVPTQLVKCGGKLALEKTFQAAAHSGPTHIH